MSSIESSVETGPKGITRLSFLGLAATAAVAVSGCADIDFPQGTEGVEKGETTGVSIQVDEDVAKFAIGWYALFLGVIAISLRSLRRPRR